MALAWPRSSSFRVWGFRGFRVSGFRVWGLGCGDLGDSGFGI